MSKCKCSRSSIQRMNKRKHPIYFISDLPRTIYTDVEQNKMPLLLQLGVSVRYYNNTTEDLYFKFFVSGTNWSSNSEAMGLLAKAENEYRNFHHFSSRSRPDSAITEVLHFEMRAYSDSGYTNLRYAFSRDTTIVMIKSNDGSWTQDYFENFESGVGGWDVAVDLGAISNGVSCGTTEEYYVSVSRSLYGVATHSWVDTVGGHTNESVMTGWRFFKELTTPDKSEVYAIINLRLKRTTQSATKAVARFVTLFINWGDTELIRCGGIKSVGEWIECGSDEFVKDEWMRFVVPLPANSTENLKIRIHLCSWFTSISKFCYSRGYIDDIKIISRD